MANPLESDVHVDAAMTAMAIAWGGQNYIWDKIAPVVPVGKQSDKYFIFDKDTLRLNEASKRAPGRPAQRGGYNLSTGAYYCDDWSIGKQTSNEALKNADGALNLDQTDTLYCTEQVNRALEIEAVASLFATSLWSADIAGVTASPTASQAIFWNLYGTSSPIENVRAQCDAVQRATGLRPNRLWMGREVHSALLDHPDVVERIGNAMSLRLTTSEVLAGVFGVEQVHVGDASYNSAQEGATAVNAFISGKNALLYYAPNTPSLDVPSAFYSMRWGNRVVLNYEDSPVGAMARVIECHDYVDFVLTSNALGVFFSAIVQ